MEKAVEAKNLSKNYGKVKALDNVSFDVNKGEIFGLIGPDGAGKTTLIRILNTLLLQDKGSATILGYDNVNDFREIRDRMGYMPGRFSLYPDLTIEENLKLFAAVFDTTIEENYKLVEKIYSQIEPFKDRQAGKLSGGMKQKLALSCALIHAPDILFLDEPTTGVDPVSRKEFWEMLGNLKEMGITIIVSTPYMDEAEKCSRIALMQDGKIMGIETPEKISTFFDRKLFSIIADDKYSILKLLKSRDDIESVHPFGDSIHVIPGNGLSEEQIQDYLRENGYADIPVSPVEPEIEDVFMYLMGQENES